MSARQTFIPRAPSRALSFEPHQHQTERLEGDGSKGKDLFVDGNGKARSISSIFGKKRGSGIDNTSEIAGPTQGPDLERTNTNTNTNRRSFEGIRRPETTPLSIIPYPATTEQLGATMQPGAGQTPRKIGGPGVFEFPRPMTPMSVQRGFKKGITFAENREDEATSNGNAHGGSIVFMEPGGDKDVRVSVGPGMGAYMRMFEGSGGGSGEDGVQSNLEHDIAAPVARYALGLPGTNPRGEGCEDDGVFARSSGPLDTMIETEVGFERNNDLQRSLGGTKRGMCHEDMDREARYTDESHQSLRGSGKRMKPAQYNPDEYFPISSPHIPPTPALQTSSVDVLDPSLVAGSLFENIEEFINLREIEAEWKRWKECSTEEWLKGADELAQDYKDIIDMVKDHLTEKVLAYASMISSVEERRTEVNRNIEIIHQKGNVVRENISRLGTKK